MCVCARARVFIEFLITAYACVCSPLAIFTTLHCCSYTDLGSARKIENRESNTSRLFTITTKLNQPTDFSGQIERCSPRPTTLYSILPRIYLTPGSLFKECVFSTHSFWTSSSLDVPAGVTQEEGHTGFLIPLLSAVRALIFLARRIQPFLSSFSTRWAFLVLVFGFSFLVRKIPFTGIELTSQRVKRLRGYLSATGATGYAEGNEGKNT